jgi:hypothetical protein
VTARVSARTPGAVKRRRDIASGAVHVIEEISFRGLFTLCSCGVTISGRTVEGMGTAYAEHRQAAKAARRAAAQAAHGPDSRPTSAAEGDPGMDAPVAAALGADAA